MDNRTYYELRRNIERFMLKHYPELHHSTVYLPKREIEQFLPVEILEQRKSEQLLKKPKNFEKQTIKKQISDTVSKILENSVSIDDFESRINKTEGFETYSRNGKLYGIVKDDKKYRFKTLGIQLLPESMEVLERLGELGQIQQNQSRNRDNDFER